MQMAEIVKIITIKSHMLHVYFVLIDLALFLFFRHIAANFSFRICIHWYLWRYYYSFLLSSFPLYKPICSVTQIKMVSMKRAAEHEYMTQWCLWKNCVNNRWLRYIIDREMNIQSYLLTCLLKKIYWHKYK